MVPKASKVSVWTSERGSIGCIFQCAASLPPAVLLAHLHHHSKDVVPRLGFHHDCIGEHAAVPAEVAEALEGVAGLVLQPVAGVFGDVEFAGGVGGQAVAAGLVVGAAAVDGG